MMRFYRSESRNPANRAGFFIGPSSGPAIPSGRISPPDMAAFLFVVIAVKMSASPECIALVQHYEGCRLGAYPDPKTGGEPYTIGWGHTGPDVKRGLTWTQKQADDALVADLQRFVDAVNGAVTITGLSQRQFDALVSITYNVGIGGKAKDGIIKLRDGTPSTLIKYVNAGNYAAAADQFLRWVSPGSAVEKGLRRRRTAERALFLGQSYESAIRAGDAA